MATLLTFDQFKARSTMPKAFLHALEDAEPGWVAAQLEMKTGWIMARLAKRYGPFQEPYPAVVLDWLTAIVTHRCWLRRGRDPLDEQAQEYTDEAETAKAEVLEAANSETGLFDLPLRADTTASGITQGGPFGYSEQSPYVSFDQQFATATGEDEMGVGTYG